MGLLSAFTILFIYLAVLSLCCSLGFSAVEVSRGCSVAVVCGLLAMVAAQWDSVIGTPNDSVVASPGLKSTDSVVVAHGLSCSKACRIFPDQESKPCLLN